MDAAALPAGALEDPPDRGLETGVVVGDDKADTGQVPFLQASEELGPERLVSGVPDIDAQHFAVAIGSETGRDHDRFGGDLAVLTDMDVGGVEPDIHDASMAEITMSQHGDVGVDVLADPRDR